MKALESAGHKLVSDGALVDRRVNTAATPTRPSATPQPVLVTGNAPKRLIKSGGQQLCRWVETEGDEVPEKMVGRAGFYK